MPNNAGECEREHDKIKDTITSFSLDTHDAFLVDTGGKLGTLLVTAELAMESKDEFGTRDITFSVWDPTELEAPIQTLTEEVMMGVAPEFHHAANLNSGGNQLWIKPLIADIPEYEIKGGGNFFSCIG